MLRITVPLALLYLAALGSDIARVYPPGGEPAKGGQDLSKPYPNGKELAHNGNGDRAHNYGDLAK